MTLALEPLIPERCVHRRTFTADSSKTPVPRSPEPKQDKKTYRNKRSQDDAISPLLGSNSPHQAINAWQLACRPDNPPIDVCQGFPLYSKIFIHRVSLAYYVVNHAVTVLDPSPFLKHVFRFGIFRIGGAISVDVGANIGEKVDTVTGV